MNQEKVFRTSRLKALRLFLGASFFAWASSYTTASRPLIGWAGMLLFGAGALMGALLLVKGRATLRLDEEGVEILSLFKRSYFRWSDIESIRMVKIRGASMIVLSHKEADARRSRGSRSLTIGNLYNVSLDDLAQTLKEWHELGRMG